MLKVIQLATKSRGAVRLMNSRAFSSSGDDGFNFIKDRNFKSGVRQHKRDLEDQYSADNHSLLPYLYLYRSLQDNIGYVLLEPRTR
jgi:hypothetical protein